MWFHTVFQKCSDSLTALSSEIILFVMQSVTLVFLFDVAIKWLKKTTMVSTRNVFIDWLSHWKDT